LNFSIMNIIQSAGARFALPGKSIYLEAEEPSTFIPDVQRPT